MGIITFLSDFGNDDWFVAAVKGEILKINPHSKIIDITHSVPRHNITVGAFILNACFRSFPDRSVHLAIVDPGVGGCRRPIIIEADDHFFVGPDNGIFSLVARGRRRAYSIKVKKEPLTTFDGRDVFAPAAAFLSMDVEPSTIGRKITKIRKLQPPFVKRAGKRIHGYIIYIDHFGNLITNIPMSSPVSSMVIRSHNRPIKKGRSYQTVKRGQLLVVKGSHGFYEIACNQGSAAEMTGAGIGTKIVARIE